MLARLKSNYQLGELVKVENYPEVIRLIANFTVTSLQVQTFPSLFLPLGFPGKQSRSLSSGSFLPPNPVTESRMDHPVMMIIHIIPEWNLWGKAELLPCLQRLSISQQGKKKTDLLNKVYF